MNHFDRLQSFIELCHQHSNSVDSMDAGFRAHMEGMGIGGHRPGGRTRQGAGYRGGRPLRTSTTSRTTQLMASTAVCVRAAMWGVSRTLSRPSRG